MLRPAGGLDLQNVMARAATAVPARVLSITSPSRSVASLGHHHLATHQGRQSTSITPLTKGSVFHRLVQPAANCCPDSASPRAFSRQARRFASQTDGLGQSETFREYRLRQQIETRRRSLRQLEEDLLTSQIEVADVRHQLNLQELASFPVGRPSPPHSDDVSKPQTTTALAASKLLQTLTPHENIYTIPNILTFTRLVAAPAVGYAILTSQPALALGLFLYAGVTDAVDGYLARRFHQTTVVGTVIDPMADKLLMTIAVVSLAIQHTIPMWLAVIIIGRDVGLAISAIYFRYISLPPPKTFSRYWDFSLPSAEVHPTEISKINTFLQLMLIGSAMSLPVLRENMPALMSAWNLGGVVEGWSYLVGATTIWSGLSYVGNKDAVKILSKQDTDMQMEVKDSGPLYRKK